MTKTSPEILLPRYWKRDIRRITGLIFCDRDCGCGEANGLWWFPTPSGRGVPEWVPGWMNGVDSYEIWRWLVENDRVPPRRRGREK
jgi:hypothetical protein